MPQNMGKGGHKNVGLGDLSLLNFVATGDICVSQTHLVIDINALKYMTNNTFN